MCFNLMCCFSYNDKVGSLYRLIYVCRSIWLPRLAGRSCGGRVGTTAWGYALLFGGLCLWSFSLLMSDEVSSPFGVIFLFVGTSAF
jgi:hypothetical protein